MELAPDGQAQEAEHDSNQTSAPRPPGFVLSKWDLEILHFVWQHRFLRREQLAVLTGRSANKLHDRLLQMSNRGYLKTLKFPQQKHIYGIAKEGIRALVRQGIVATDVLDERLRSHELTQYYLEHEMLIVDVHIALTMASKEGPIRLVDWKQGKTNYDSVMVEGERIPVSPDAFLTLEDGRRPAESNLAHFFLEADLSSENHRYFKNKIVGATHYYRQGLHEKKFGIKGFRVLTVALNQARARNLCALAQSLLPEGAFRKLFLFTSLENFSLEEPKTILEPICFSPRDAELKACRPLLPAPPTTPPPSAS
jgi:hypothetical protein